MLSPGTVFAGRYEILRTISAGGMGTVYEVLHRETRRRRALKVMLPNMLKDADLRRRFALEAQVTADVESEHIVETFDAGVDAETGSPFLVMELLRGEDLGARLARLVRLPPREVVGLLGQAAEALDKTHAAGIVHRDLKPENLYAVARDGTLRIKLLDFGIAKVVRQTEVGKATRSMGTPLYMAPEQFDGEPRLGPRVDLYALAHIAYTLLVGEAYWSDEAHHLANALALMKRVANGAVEPAVTRASRVGVVLPAAFDGWFDHATAVDPDERFASAAETVEALAEALGERAALGEPVPGTVPTTDDPARGSVITPAGSRTPRPGIGSETTLAEPERKTPGGSGGTSPGATAARERSKVGIPVFAAVAAVSIGITYFFLQSGSAPAPGETSSRAAASAPPTASATAAAEAPRPAASPTDPSVPAAAVSTLAPPASALPAASVEPKVRPPAPRTSAAATSAAATSAAPPPSAPPPAAPPPAEPWRTR